MTGWWKTDQSVTRTRPIPFYWSSYWLHSYTTHTQCHYQALLNGLLFWSKFCQPCKFITGTMRLMEGTTWKAWVSFTHAFHVVPSTGPIVVLLFWISQQWYWGDSYAIEACLGLWLALLGFIASPNSPNRGFNPPPAAHPLPPSIYIGYICYIHYGHYIRYK